MNVRIAARISAMLCKKLTMDIQGLRDLLTPHEIVTSLRVSTANPSPSHLHGSGVAFNHRRQLQKLALDPTRIMIAAFSIARIATQNDSQFST